MPAYWLARAEVVDPENYKKYTDHVPGILKKYGGKPLARGGDFKLMELNDQIKWGADFNRFIVVEFESMEAAETCYNSPEYQSAMQNRLGGAGINELVLVDGGDKTK